VKNLALEIGATRVPPHSVALWWLAQAGFVLKSPKGTTIYLDAYLSDGVERAFGFKRLSLAPIEATEVRADWFVSSHEHLDHLDLDSLPAIAKGNPHCRFAGTRSCFPGYEEAGIPPSRTMVLEAGADAMLLDVRVRTARADHGVLSPDALSLAFDVDGTRIVFTGDTALRPDWIGPLLDPRPDVLLPCINGAFGNLDAEGAAELARCANPRVVVPCHFWMFKEHGGDPEAFVQAVARKCPATEVILLTPGEGLIVSPRDARRIRST
jgi:L-ascorbate 6-phosphate lactonase